MSKNSGNNSLDYRNKTYSQNIDYARSLLPKESKAKQRETLAATEARIRTMLEGQGLKKTRVDELATFMAANNISVYAVIAEAERRAELTREGKIKGAINAVSNKKLT